MTIRTDAPLACPYCGGQYLHHQSVKMFDRGEDEKLVHVTTATGREAAITVEDSAFAKNPSARRGGLKVRFDCEGCGDHPVLRIAQHKGNTYLSWEHPSDPDGTPLRNVVW